MKLVTFNRVMRGVPNPALLPDDVAAAAHARGELAKDPEQWPAETKPATAKPLRRFGRRSSELLGQTYLTK